MAGELPTYPKRPSHYAHKVVRAMVKTCVAQEHGQGVFLLVCVIAHTEDARHYTSAVTFWNEQLAHVAGFANVKAMDRQREKAVESGWLVYVPGRKSTPGKYWVQIPEQFAGLDDAPTDEGPNWVEELTSPLATSNLTNKVGRQPGENRETSGETTGREPGDKWATFNPVPNPIPVPDVASATSVIVATEKPKPLRRFIPPTVDEVRAYVAETKSPVDADAFVNFYESKGWMVGRNPMKSWQAAVRTWSRSHVGGRETQFGSVGGAATTFGATSSHRQAGGLFSREQQREAANKAALVAFLQSEGVCESNLGFDEPKANVGLHGRPDQGVVLRLEAVPGAGDQSIGGRASNVGDAISGACRPVQAVSAEDASGLRPDGG